MAHFGRACRASSCPLSGVFLPRSFIVGAAVDDPWQHFATIKSNAAVRKELAALGQSDPKNTDLFSASSEAIVKACARDISLQVDTVE